MKKTFQSPSLRTINVKAQSLMTASGASGASDATLSGFIHTGKAGSNASVYGRETAPAAGVWED